MYSFDTESIVYEFKQNIKDNEDAIIDAYQNQINRAEEMIDIQYKIQFYF